MDWVLVKCNWCDKPGVMMTNKAGRLACEPCLAELMREHDDLKIVEELSDESEADL